MKSLLFIAIISVLCRADTLKVLCFGQSNMTARDVGHEPTIAQPKALKAIGGSILHLSDNWLGDSSSDVASILPDMCNEFLDSVPGDTTYILVFGDAEVGRGLYGLTDDDHWHKRPARLFDGIAAQAKLHSPDWILSFVGEQDAVLGMAVDSVTNGLTDIKSWLEDTTSTSMNMLVIVPGWTSSDMSNVWAGEISAANGTDIFAINTYDCELVSTTDQHFNYFGRVDIGKRAGRLLAKSYNGTIAGTGWRGPYISGAIDTLPRGTVRAAITFGQGVSLSVPASAHNNFSARWTNGLPVGIYYLSGDGDDKILITTTDRMCNGLDIRSINPLAAGTGSFDRTKVIYDNTGLPLEPLP